MKTFEEFFRSLFENEDYQNSDWYKKYAAMYGAQTQQPAQEPAQAPQQPQVQQPAQPPGQVPAVPTKRPGMAGARQGGFGANRGTGGTIRTPMRTGQIVSYGGYEHREKPPIGDDGQEMYVADDMMRANGGPYYDKPRNENGKLVRYIVWPGVWKRI